MGFLNERRLDDHAQAGRPDIAPHNEASRFGRGKSIPLSARVRLSVSAQNGCAARQGLASVAFDDLRTPPQQTAVT
jgi:hypothetical protein